eukprot:PhM_4_TR16597/c0_g1_i1/m.2607/K19995/SCAMP; secretory carrier-associated membrane protein
MSDALENGAPPPPPPPPPPISNSIASAASAASAQGQAAAYSMTNDLQARAAAASAQAEAAAQDATAATMSRLEGAINRVGDEARYARLKAREQELVAKETDLARMEFEFGQLLRKTQPNWPKQFLCLRPIVHHDILGDIRPDRCQFVRMCYFNYYYTCFMLIANSIVAIIALSSPKKDTVKGSDEYSEQETWMKQFGVSIIHLLGLVFSFIVWYWPTYKACGQGRSSQYVMAFIGNAVGLCYAVFASIGIMGYGLCGLSFAFDANRVKGEASFLSSLILSVLFIIQGCLFVFALWRLRKYYKQDKASLTKAKAELLAASV